MVTKWSRVVTKWSRVVTKWSQMVKSGRGGALIWAWRGDFMVAPGAGGGGQGYSWWLGGVMS